MSNPMPAATTARDPDPAGPGQNPYPARKGGVAVSDDDGDQSRITPWRRYKLVGGLVVVGLLVCAVLVLRQPTTPPTAQPTQQPIQVLPTLLPGHDDVRPPADPAPVRLTLDLGGRVAVVETSSWSGSILGLGLHRSSITVTVGSAEASAMVFGGGSVAGPPADPADAGCFDMVSSDQRDGSPSDPTLTAAITSDGTATILIHGPGQHLAQTISLALPGCPHETPSATPTNAPTGGAPMPGAALSPTHAGRPAPG